MKTNLLKNPLGKKLSPQAAQQLMALAALLILYVLPKIGRASCRERV